jgi:hypothetical protein
MSTKPIRITHWKLGRIKRDSDHASGRSGPRNRALGFRTEPGWAVLGVFGWMLALVGAIDLALVLVPFELSAEWEFATAVALVSGLPVPTMGLALIIASALKRRARKTARFAGTIALLGSGGIMIGLVVFALTIPVALRFIQDSLIRQGLYKAIIKTSGQAVLYSAGLGLIGFQAWRQSRHRQQAEPDSGEEIARK